MDGVDGGGILVKVNTKTGETKLLMSNSLNHMAPLFRNAIAYNGKLYFCGSVHVNGRSGLPSVYEIDPTDDSYKAVYVGLSSMQDYGAAYKKGISTGIRGMCVYNGKLVISNVFADATTGKSGATILASSNPSEGFTVIASQRDLFDYPAYTYRDSIYGGSVWDMVEYNGHLYVSICTGTEENAPDDNTMQSFAIVRGDENADGTFAWTPLIGDQKKDGARYTFGIDPERTRSGAANLIVYKDHLYIGEYNDEEIPLEEGKDVLQSIADYYMWRNQCPRAMGPENIIARKKYIFDLAEKYRADGIIVENMKFCEYWGYERALASHVVTREFGIPSVAVDRQNATGGSGQLRTRVQAFVESLEIKQLQAQRGGK